MGRLNDAHRKHKLMNIKAKLEGNLIKGHRSTVLHGQEAVEYQKKRQQEQDSIVPDPTTEITPKDRLTVTNLKVEHTEKRSGYDQKRELDFTIQTEQVGDHLYINPMLFPQLETNPFIQTDRVLPVEFPYPYKFTLLCKLALPEGYEVEELPQSQFIRAEGGSSAMQIYDSKTREYDPGQLQIPPQRIYIPS